MLDTFEGERLIKPMFLLPCCALGRNLRVEVEDGSALIRVELGYLDLCFLSGVIKGVYGDGQDGTGRTDGGLERGRTSPQEKSKGTSDNVIRISGD